MMNFWKNMTTKKKVLIGVIAVFIVLALAGCGVAVAAVMKPDTPPPETTVATEPAETTAPTTVPTTVPETTEPTVAETTEATVPTETTVPVTEPEETTPATEPMVTEPAETTPKETQPKETEPEVTEPQKPTEPKPTDPPKETQPKPTDPPKETQPKPTEPPKTHTHSYKAKVVEPTCEEKGYTVHTCSCGDSYTDSEVDALGHDMREDINEPGPGYEGYTYHFCSRCDYSYKDNFVDALPEVTTEDIQKAIIKYINQYRAEQGSTQLTYLPGMTNVAKYRSKQLTTNFAHDENDIREAHAYYQYGELVDMTTMGYDESYNYYDAKDNEACAYGSYYGTADEIGQQFAQGFKNSSGHWRYVSSSEYSYTGVGVTKSGSRWYVCVIVGRVNYG